MEWWNDGICKFRSWNLEF